MSFAYLLAAGGDRAAERHETQYFEMFGSRAIYHRRLEGGRRSTRSGRCMTTRIRTRRSTTTSGSCITWRRTCPSPATWRREQPELLAELVELWWGRGQPQPGAAARQPGAVGAGAPQARPPAAARRSTGTSQGGAQVPETVAVNVRNRSHELVVDVTIVGPDQTDGVLLALGSALGGWSLHILRRPGPLRAQPVRQANGT